MDRNEALAQWSALVGQARSRGCRSINVGTANRRQVVLAINEIVNRAALDAPEKKCVWATEENDGTTVYATSCAHAWFFTEGNRQSNDVTFCPFCGNKIEEKSNDTP